MKYKHDRNLGIILIMLMISILFVLIYHIDIFKLGENFFKIPISMVITILSFLLLVIILNFLELFIIQLFHIIRVEYAVLFPFVIDEKRFHFMPLKLLPCVQIMNDPFLYNVIPDWNNSAFIKNKVKQILFIRYTTLLFIIVSLSTLLYHQIFAFYLIYIFLILFLLIQTMDYYGWIGDFILFNKDALLRQILQINYGGFSEQDYIGIYNQLKQKNDGTVYYNFLIHILYFSISKKKCFIQSDVICNIYTDILKQKNYAISLENLELEIQLVIIQRLIGIAGLICKNKDYIDLADQLIKKQNIEILNSGKYGKKCNELVEANHEFIYNLKQKCISMVEFRKIDQTQTTLFRYQRNVLDEIQSYVDW